MLQLLLGRAGFGKTTYVRGELARLAQDGGEHAVLLVPDQFSFDNECAMLNMVGPALAANIQIFTFSRLAEAVFRTYGGITEKRIDDSARTLLMALAIASCEDGLSLYANAAKSDRITGLILEAIDEFKSAGIAPKDLFTVAEKTYGALHQKMEELALIYAAFEAMLLNSYIEPGDMLTRLWEILREKPFFQGKTVFIDGFEGFNRQKMRVLSTILRDSEKVVCTLCCDSIYENDNLSIFSPIRKTARNLVALARESGVSVAAPIVLKKPRRFENPSISVLEEKLFRNERIAPEEELSGITVYEARDIYGEIEYVAATIRNLMMSGYRYGDISVICRNAQKYFFLVENTFQRWEIPAFIAKPAAVDSAPLMRLVLSAFTVVEYGFRTEDILTMLKTGLCGISGKELSTLENYVYLWQLNGSDWKNPFVKSPDGFGTKVFPEALAELETLRQRVISPLLSFGEKTAEASGTEISAAVYELLLDLNSETALLQTVATLTGRGLAEAGDEQIRIWKRLMDILDRFAMIIGDKRLSRSRYGKLLREVLAKEEVMDIPLRHDTVIFGTADQVKQESPKITFLLGAVQGEFPLIPVEKGVFSEAERKSLLALQFPLESELESDALLERFYTYSAACAASEKLYITYPLSCDNEDCAPSELVSWTLHTFPRLRLTKNLPRVYFANAKEPVFSAAAGSFRENTVESLSFLEALAENKEYAGRLEAVARIAEKTNFEIRDKSISRKMFRENHFSPSQIETYHRCRFQYFCKYGLAAKERKPAEINVLEYGTLMHYLFESVLSEGLFHDGHREELSDKIAELIVCYADERMGGFAQMSARDQYRFKRMADTALVILLQMMEELSQSKFKPAYLELSLQDGGICPPLKVKTRDGDVVTVGGVIDRVDIYNSPNGKYVRVVDYKTGNKEFKLVDVLVGLNLQILIYLAALSEKGMLPAGALYMPAAFPTLSAEKGTSEEKLHAERAKKLCMNGLVLDDFKIITAMEEAAVGKYIPVGIKQGKYIKPESAYKSEDFNTIFAYVRSLISTMAAELVNGKIEATPLSRNVNPCEYCPFGAVCSAALEGKEELSLPKEAILEIMREGETDE